MSNIESFLKNLKTIQQQASDLEDTLNLILSEDTKKSYRNRLLLDILTILPHISLILRLFPHLLDKIKLALKPVKNTINLLYLNDDK